MAPFEALYRWQCRTPLFWSQTGESHVFGLEVLKGAEKQVQMVHEGLKVAQSRQKSYADKRRRDFSFEIKNFIYLKVSPMRGICRFRVKGKLAPRYVDHSRLLIAREKWLINSSYHHSCRKCTMCFTYHS
jgi:hypothetical protein